MMPKIVDDPDAARFPAHLLPPRDSLKTFQRLADLFERHAVETRRGNRHRGIAHIEFPDERDVERVLPQGEA
jgi:hypothetical protein